MDPLHCKNIRISTDISWRVVHILTEPVPYTFAFVNRRSPGPHCIDLRTQNVYGTDSVSVIFSCMFSMFYVFVYFFLFLSLTMDHVSEIKT